MGEGAKQALQESLIKLKRDLMTCSRARRRPGSALGVAANCYYHLSLAGGTFKEVQLPVLVGDPAAMPTQEEKRGIELAQHACPPFSVRLSEASDKEGAD